MISINGCGHEYLVEFNKDGYHTSLPTNYTCDQSFITARNDETQEIETIDVTREEADNPDLNFYLKRILILGQELEEGYRYVYIDEIKYSETFRNEVIEFFKYYQTTADTAVINGYLSSDWDRKQKTWNWELHEDCGKNKYAEWMLIIRDCVPVQGSETNINRNRLL